VRNVIDVLEAAYQQLDTLDADAADEMRG